MGHTTDRGYYICADATFVSGPYKTHEEAQSDLQHVCDHLIKEYGMTYRIKPEDLSILNCCKECTFEFCHCDQKKG